MKNFNTGFFIYELVNCKNYRWETLMIEKNKRKMKEEKKSYMKRNPEINN